MVKRDNMHIYAGVRDDHVVETAEHLYGRGYAIIQLRVLPGKGEVLPHSGLLSGVKREVLRMSGLPILQYILLRHLFVTSSEKLCGKNKIHWLNAGRALARKDLVTEWTERNMPGWFTIRPRGRDLLDRCWKWYVKRQKRIMEGYEPGT